ncbi:hypothetical protein GCM10023321_12390 [Pseudonocardia eucalypti]|uniref:Flavin reductase like domain-containing protein n=1 Tax=Pseudonocardia eucalypti TaxID=648755 RepID=A0ABP9PRH3_9PSEU|nr:flavin reductase (DIM6/NTAB) family NADH-FMN oxidoreductase RutF [Pseudonocardia eucalypti]
MDATDQRHFREVLGNFPTSVVAITVIGSDRRPAGMIVGSFTSVSLDPPLVSFLADRSSRTHLLVVGRVRGLRAGSPKTPLLFFRGGYGDYFSPTSLLLDRLVGG